MSAHLAPVEAYRRDLARLTRTMSFGDEDDGWLLLAHVLWSRARSREAIGDVPASGDDGSELRRLAASVAAARALDDEQAAAVATIALRMEAAGALLLAATTLASAERLLGDARALQRGRVLAQWARVERLLGETDVAADLYARTRAIGVRARLPELRVRADLGLGVLARMRGNYPMARRRFRGGLAVAEDAGLAELAGLAHQSLLVAAAVARDFDTALWHGWCALAYVAGDRGQESEVLLNLATLCLDDGHPDAALRGFLAAAERAAKERVRVAAQAGAAVAAARTGDHALLLACAADVEHALLGEVAPYERAQRLLTLADAWSAAGDVRAARSARQRGLAVARAHGFAELVHEYDGRADRADAAGAAAPAHAAPLGEDALRVVRTLAALDDERLDVLSLQGGGAGGGGALK